HNVLVDLAWFESSVAACSDDAAVLRCQLLPQLALGLPDAAAELVVQLHREVCDQLVWEVCGNILLLATDDPHRDHCIAGFRVESLVCWGLAGSVELLHELCPRLVAGRPAEQTPDR